MRNLKYGVLIIFIVACTANLGNVPWHMQVHKWTPEQRASFFMDAWEAEEATYNRFNSTPDKTPELIEALKKKHNILEKSRVPIRAYSTLVKSGGNPGAEDTQKIVDWLQELQLQSLQGGV